jgi:adenylylsulfate kinase
MPGYIEIYLAVPLDELRRRDPKHIYARADRGELQDVAGLDFAVDEPQAPDLCIKWSPELSEEQTADSVFELLKLESLDEN